mmetsp:Transcript_18413/g.30850  ORF Transcript_18413/g.30850 Transcript_18413/m.30850 type:complete len:356 (-) Transcript_18413:528-1595(-)
MVHLYIVVRRRALLIWLVLLLAIFSSPTTKATIAGDRNHSTSREESLSSNIGERELTALQGPKFKPIRKYGDMPSECSCLLKNEKENLFRVAQMEIGKDASALLTNSSVKNFFFHNWGARSFQIHEKKIIHAVIFKNNHEAIDSSLSRVARKKFSLKNNNHVTTPVVAFIREPLGHLLSGLVECNFRSLGMKSFPDMSSNVYKERVKSHQTTVETAKKALVALITGGYDGVHALKYMISIEHISTQMPQIQYWQPQFVGNLENFDADWKAMNKFYHVHVPYTGGPKHPTMHSVDALNMHHSLEAFLRQNKQYTRALCRLLMIDYYCLKYPLPAECADMYAEASWRCKLNACSTKS